MLFLLFIYFICDIFFVIILWKIYLEITSATFLSWKRLDGKTALIIGGDEGVGKEVTLDLVKRGARVIIGCQLEDTALIVKDEIRGNMEKSEIIIKEIDLSSFKSIRKFSKEIHESEEKIDILINCAVVSHSTAHTADGISKLLQVNLLGPYLTIQLLYDLVQKSSDGRIIFVGSLAALLSYGNNFNSISGKGISKLKLFGNEYVMTMYGLILISNEFARKLKNSNVTVNVVNSGLVDINVIYNFDFFKKLLQKSARVLLPLIKFYAKSPKQGAQSVIYAAVSDDMEKQSGTFIVECESYNLYKTPKHSRIGANLMKNCDTMLLCA